MAIGATEVSAAPPVAEAPKTIAASTKPKVGVDTGQDRANQYRGIAAIKRPWDFITRLANKTEPPPLATVDSGVPAAFVEQPVSAVNPDAAAAVVGSDAPAPAGEEAPTSSSPVESVSPPAESTPETAAPAASTEAPAVTPVGGVSTEASVAPAEPAAPTPAVSSEPVSTMTSEEVAAAAKKLETEAYMKITTLLSQDIAADADPEELMEKLHMEKGWVRNDKTIDYIKGAIKFKQDKVAEEARTAAEAAAAGAPSPEAQARKDAETIRILTEQVNKLAKGQEEILKYLAEKETDKKKKKFLLELLAIIAIAPVAEILTATMAEATPQQAA